MQLPRFLFRLLQLHLHTQATTLVQRWLHEVKSFDQET
jgi:hypothetical protein